MLWRRAFFVMEHKNVFKSVTNVFKYAPKVKMVVVGRRESRLIHFHTKINFIWVQLMSFYQFLGHC